MNRQETTLLALSLFTLMTPLVSSCSSDDHEETLSEQRLLTVEVSERPMTDENGKALQAPTRTEAPTSTASLTAFTMNYQTNKYIFTKSGTEWNTFSWPSGVGNNDQIDFYAYSSGSFIWDSSNPYLTFTLNSDAFNQHDLLVATHKGIAYSDTKGQVSLEFDHACAAIKFNICKTTGVAERTIIITDVSLSGVKNRGEYHYNATDPSPVWQNLQGTQSYKLNDSDITLTTDMQELPCHYLFLPPQDKTDLTLTVSYTADGTPGSHAFTWTSGTWEAGHAYNVNISMGTAIIH